MESPIDEVLCSGSIDNDNPGERPTEGQGLKPTSTCPQTEMNDHPATLGLKFDQIEFSSPLLLALWTGIAALNL